MHNVKQTIKRLAATITTAAIIAGGSIAIANPASIVSTSPAGRMEAASEATTYLYNGRTRVNLPADVLDELDAWATAYTAQLERWNEQDGSDYNAYYGGMEEGYSYALTMILSRLGYTDGTPTSDTLQDVPSWWGRTAEGREFSAWETAAFGELN